MYKFLLYLPIFLFSSLSFGQEMTSARLMEIIEQESDTLNIQGNSVQFLYNETMLVCIYDEGANRMRIVTPIVELEKLEEDQVLNALVANFHSALDVKYALSNEIIWSIYVHPLRELTDGQVVDAINQVYAAAVTFGSTYSSTNLVFPGNTEKKSPPEEKILKKF